MIIAMKSKKELEGIMKGVANHRRLEIALLLQKMPGLSLTEISSVLRVNFKTIAEHVRRLSIAGLVQKRHEGAAVRHTLSSRARNVLKFLRTLE